MPTASNTKTAIIVLIILLVIVAIALIIWAAVSSNNDDDDHHHGGGALAEEAGRAPLATVEDNGASNTDPHSVKAESVSSDDVAGRKAPTAILAEMKKASPLAKDGGKK